ncbi:MAG: 2-amino-4-hydroxy-6-hydroxymethyldihydropteridine diphosphokinase [Gammaproteobacteria bacterium]|nr:2-amino-4-hydroxy-6-hydroxymethyldihydropteridine diphosphokinase [Gammaproteobacteria bacterium]
MPEVFVGAGSNVAAERHLRCAMRELVAEFPGTRFSAWYRNRAVGGAGADFINLAAVFVTPLPLSDVRARLRVIEERCGRSRQEPSPRPPPLDLDLLLYGDLVRVEPGFELPRPELLTRAHVLGPLAELAPQARHPTALLTFAELWQRFDRTAHPLERLP